MFVANGANINFIDGNSWTPLSKAIRYKHYDITKYLIDQGANVNLIGNIAWTPLNGAITNHNLEIVRLLVKNGADINDVRTECLPISCAIEYDAIEIVKFFMDNGANLNYQDSEGNKPIEVALQLHEHVQNIMSFKMLVL